MQLCIQLRIYIRYIMGRKAMEWRGGRIGRKVDRDRVGDTGGERGG